MKRIYQKINKVKNLGSGHHANCWGTTLFILGFNPSLKWELYVPTAFALKKCSNLVTSTDYQIGDILVLKNNGTTVHTAIYIGQNKWFHKAGSLPPCNNRLKTIVDFFSFCSNSYEIRRINNSKLLDYQILKDLTKYIDQDYDDVIKI